MPRHVFLPEMAATEVYQDEAFVIKTDDDGMPVSSSSQPAIMAIMLEQLGLSRGSRVLEIGTGTGWNAALMAFLVGERGSVVTVDIDADLVARARANLAVAGYAQVVVIYGDGGFGAPDHAPFDRIIVTAGAWDLAPDWLAQLGLGGRIVLPLSVRGIQLCMALEREAGHWRSRSASRCGFIRMAGAFAGPDSFAPLGPQPGLHVQTDDGRRVDVGALYAVLNGPATDVPAGVRVAGLSELGEADLWLTVTEPDLVRLTITGAGPSAGKPGRGHRRPRRGHAPPGAAARGAPLRGIRHRRPWVRLPRPRPGRPPGRPGAGLGRTGPARGLGPAPECLSAEHSRTGPPRAGHPGPPAHPAGAELARPVVKARSASTAYGSTLASMITAP